VVTGIAFQAALPICIAQCNILHIIAAKIWRQRIKEIMVAFSVKSFIKLLLRKQTNMLTIPPKNGIFPGSIIPTVAGM
jgi:hypothetical protein